MSGLAIVAGDLAKSFGEQVAVADVDLEIASGEIFGVLGPHGAGKSTTVRMLCTLLHPTSGSARVAGYDVATEAQWVRPHIGVALQDTALDDRQTGRETLAVQGRLYGLRGAVLADRIERTLELVDLGDVVGRRVGTYSRGTKRRLDLAAALVHQPDVLFLDEPTTGLDPISRVRVWDEIGRLNAELGVTVFLTTPHVEEADRLAHRVGIIDEGRIVAEGTPEHLKRAVGAHVVVVDLPDRGDQAVGAVDAVEGLDGIDRVELADGQLRVVTGDGAALVAPVAVALGRAGIEPTAVTVRMPTLDDVFLRATGHRLANDIPVDGAP